MWLFLEIQQIHTIYLKKKKKSLPTPFHSVKLSVSKSNLGKWHLQTAEACAAVKMAGLECSNERGYSILVNEGSACGLSLTREQSNAAALPVVPY